MSIGESLPFPEILETVTSLLSINQKIYLVGGSLRDFLLGRQTHDLDFLLDDDVRPIARRTANALDGAFFMLDDERNTARVIVRGEDGRQVWLDFAEMRGGSLEEDLRLRDFTINAMALDLTTMHRLIDPLGGAADLKAGLLRACAETAFTQDPLRILRAVRLALALRFRILPATLQGMRSAVGDLERVSAERQRDELFRILEGSQVRAALWMLDSIGVISRLLPELVEMKGVAQPPPHIYELWEHTLAAVQELEKLFGVLVGDYDEAQAANLRMGLAVLRLGRFRRQLAAYFGEALSGGRSQRALLFLAALYHDAGKPAARQVRPDGRVQFIGHEEIGGERMLLCARRLALSQAEARHLALIVRRHMHLHSLVNSDQPLSRRSVYRFWRAAGEAGVDLCLLSLADKLATEGIALSTEAWIAELDVCRTLLESWFEERRAILPPPLLSGDDLMLSFDLKPGPLIGELLGLLVENQAAGEIADRQQALDFIARRLSEPDSFSTRGE